MLSSSNTAIAAPYAATTSVNITIAVPNSMNMFCIAGKCYNRTSYGDVTQYVSLFGKRFSGMGGMNLKCNESVSIALNNGWTMSADTNEALLAIYMYGFSWNTWLIITANGRPYEAALYGIYNGGAAFYTVPNAFGPGTTGYRAQMCDSRLLITQDFPAPEPSTDIVAPPRISNFITFNGYDYGVADNVAPNNATATCPLLVGVYLDGSSAWSIAPKEDASQIAIYSTTTSFGTACLNTADGSGLTSTGAACASPDSFIPVSYNGGMIYFTPNCTRILLRRPSTSAPSWVATSTITNSFTTGKGISGTFATLANTNPKATDGASSCQSNFMTVPAGWRLTTPTEMTTFVTNNAWSFSAVYCFATDGGSTDNNGAACTTLIKKTVDGVDYYSPSTCSQVLIIRST